MKDMWTLTAGPLWKVTSTGLEAIGPQPFASEAALESLIESSPGILGEKLLMIGRQVRTPGGRILDLLALDEHGATKVIEIKKGRAKDDAIGQLFAYNAWATKLDRVALEAIYAEYATGLTMPTGPDTLARAFAMRFDKPLPSSTITQGTIALVAHSVDRSTLEALSYAGRHGLRADLHLVSSHSAEGETWVSASRQNHANSQHTDSSDTRAQLQEIRFATLDAVRESTTRLLSRLDAQSTLRPARPHPFYSAGAHGDILCFAQLFMPRFTASYVPYSLLEELYLWWVGEQAGLGVTRAQPAHGFSQQLAAAIAMVGGWRKQRRFWDDDPSLVNERLRLLVHHWQLPSAGQHLSGYARK